MPDICRRSGVILMEKQVIVSIGREYGSAGHVVAHKLADKLGIEVLIRNICILCSFVQPCIKILPLVH